LADRKGRKLMCMRASGVMALTITATGFAPNAIYIIVMRFIQGAFSGYINNATALIAGETPHRKSGWVMSQMMTAGTAGNLVGPLLGGVLSNFFGNWLGGVWGYRIPFFITGFLMVLVFLGSTFLVHDINTIVDCLGNSFNMFTQIINPVIICNIVVFIRLIYRT